MTIATAERLGARDHPVFGGSVSTDGHVRAEGIAAALGVPAEA